MICKKSKKMKTESWVNEGIIAVIYIKNEEH